MSMPDKIAPGSPKVTNVGIKLLKMTIPGRVWCGILVQKTLQVLAVVLQEGRRL